MQQLKNYVFHRWPHEAHDQKTSHWLAAADPFRAERDAERLKMPKFVDLTGRRFGRWLVLSRAENKARTQWLCVCDCGTTKSVQGANLTNGTSISCGCYRDELPRTAQTAAVTRHGMTDSPTWNSWMAMIKRCYGKYSINYANYGGRGIEVCKRWVDSFEEFLADMGERPEGMSIDRINVNGNYEPGNCRWATRKQQARNTTTNKIVLFEGKSYCQKELAEKLGIGAQTIRKRMRKGIPLEMPRWNGRREN